MSMSCSRTSRVRPRSRNISITARSMATSPLAKAASSMSWAVSNGHGQCWPWTCPPRRRPGRRPRSRSRPVAAPRPRPQSLRPSVQGCSPASVSTAAARPGCTTWCGKYAPRARSPVSYRCIAIQAPTWPGTRPASHLIVAKTHNPMADFQAFVAGSADPVAITVRDPRDAVVSFMQRFPNSLGASFDQALAAIVLSAERLTAVSRLRDVPVFRYEW